MKLARFDADQVRADGPTLNVPEQGAGAPVVEADEDEVVRDEVRDKPARSRSRSRGKPKADAPREVAPAPRAEPKAEPRPAPEARAAPAPAPAPAAKPIDDAADEWNGPVPGFLSFSAL